MKKKLKKQELEKVALKIIQQEKENKKNGKKTTNPCTSKEKIPLKIKNKKSF